MLKIKLLLVLLWVAVIIVATCNNDAQSFIYDQEVHFSFTTAPDFTELLRTDDISFSDGFYLFQKTGHFLSFALLYVLLYALLKHRKQAFLICAAFALVTELLQLFFERDGRLFDVLVDVLGTLTAVVLIHFFLNIKRIPLKDSY